MPRHKFYWWIPWKNHSQKNDRLLREWLSLAWVGIGVESRAKVDTGARTSKRIHLLFQVEARYRKMWAFGTCGCINPNVPQRNRCEARVKDERKSQNLWRPITEKPSDMTPFKKWGSIFGLWITRPTAIPCCLNRFWDAHHDAGNIVR